MSSAKSPTPVIFCSHGSTMMLGEDSAPGRYWESVGLEAKQRGIKGVIFMGAHWEVSGEGFEVASNATNPKKQPVAWVEPTKYQNYKINVSPSLAGRVVDALTDSGLQAKLNPDVEWIHDIFLVLTWMFPGESPPVTLISCNAFYDPWTHVDVGLAVRKFRHEDILIVGSGGTVHNLYRNHWDQVIRFRDNFAQEYPPEQWALDFRTTAEDALTKNSGPALRRAAIRLMRHPLFRDAHATDDHFASVLFVAGAAGAPEDEGTVNRAMAECWELRNMCNTQFQFGEW